MKNQSLKNRFLFACNGIRSTWAREKSFRTHSTWAVIALLSLIVLRPQPLWWALFLLLITCVLSAELVNTALENVIDRLHPEQHPSIGLAKDCAAGAVLVFALAAVLIFIALLVDRFLI